MWMLLYKKTHIFDMGYSPKSDLILKLLKWYFPSSTTVWGLIRGEAKQVQEMAPDDQGRRETRGELQRTWQTNAGYHGYIKIKAYIKHKTSSMILGLADGAHQLANFNGNMTIKRWIFKAMTTMCSRNHQLC